MAALLVTAAWAVIPRWSAAQQPRAAALLPAAITVKTARATAGPVFSSLTYPSDVKAVFQLNVVPKATGRIERLLVATGSRVKKGDTIAELESAALKAQVSQAKANLASATARYQNMVSGPREEQVEQARAALDAAEARAALVKRGATESDLAAAQSAVDSARAGLASAQARLELVKAGPTAADLAAAQAAVDSASATLRSAEARLNQTKSGATVADLQAAQSAVASAKTALMNAQDVYEAAQDDLSKVSGKVSSVSQAFQAVQAAQAAYDSAVQRLNQLQAGPLAADLQAAQSAYDSAKASSDSAIAKLNQMKAGPTPQDIQQAQAAVDSAVAALAGAEARLKQLQAGPTPEDVAAAEAAVRQAEQAYRLARAPFTKGDLDQARAGVDQAQAALELAEIALSESLVLSPVDGVVADRLQSVGALVGPQTPIVSLVSDEVELTLSVEEAKVGQLREGQRAEISATAFPGVTFRGKVVGIAPTADAKNRTFQVRVRPEDQDGRLKQGMFAQVKIVTLEKEKAITVPKDAVLTRSGQTLVLVVAGDVVQERPISLGPVQAGIAEVTAGLEAGEEVVVAGQNDLRDGDRVQRG